MKDQSPRQRNAPARPVEPKPSDLQKLVEEVGRDARANPNRYLRETRVPGGGE